VVAEQDQESRTLEPARFHAPGEVLRIVTTASGNRWPYLPGILVANILSGPTLAREATARSELFAEDTLRVDTTYVHVRGRPLYLFVAEHTALLEWRVVVQAGRPREER
jgi:hypothetical protein